MGEPGESLEDWLAALGKRHKLDYLQYIESLKSQGIKTKDDLMILTEEDIKETVKDTGMGKPARRHFIDALKGTTRRESVVASRTYVLPMSDTTWKTYKALGEKQKEAKDVEKAILDNQEEIPKLAEKIKKQIQAEFKAVVEAASARVKVLEEQVDRDAKKALAAGETELKVITDFMKAVETTKTDCKGVMDLLEFDHVAEGEKKIQKLCGEFENFQIRKAPLLSLSFASDSKALVSKISTEGLVKCDTFVLDSTILEPPDWRTVFQFFDVIPSEIKLLYRGSRDGFAASNFHSACDGKGPTFTVVRSTNSAVFGGFNSESWSSSSGYIASTTCWLFTLVNSQKIKLVSTGSNAAYNDSRYGPTWGSARNLSISGASNSSDSTAAADESYKRVDGKYDSTTLAGASKFTLAEIEIYSCNIKSPKDEKEFKLDSDLLSSDMWTTVKSFFTAPPKSLSLLWRGSRDGFEATTFHSLCDGKGPTLTVIRATTGAIFGGYAADAWDSSGTAHTATNSWMFTLYDSQKIKLTPISSSYTTYSDPSYGPTWGGGYDLCVSDNCDSNNSSYARSSSSYYRRVDGGSYDNSTLAGAENFTVTEIETHKCEF